MAPATSNERPYRYDPEKAKQILAKAGLTHVAFTLAVSNQPPYLDIAQALQGSFAKGGVKVDVVPGLSAQVSTHVKNHDFEANLGSWGAELLRPEYQRRHFRL